VNLVPCARLHARLQHHVCVKRHQQANKPSRKRRTPNEGASTLPLDGFGGEAKGWIVMSACRGCPQGRERLGTEAAA
jgi:hypothetical protein